ncbi:hypothetical protein GSI_03157 [Ganoderma sinense ZZ0214-1]|uniref:Uncharacterized protein n=1 Tax=Ganoderma sinense ZZ0214-1 TaxID=1077348 RepID=A0A2G8SKU9_9APHY|nr:hypothetical protein GSI_03157 [Ganoderma sinense ZZ0214-1]
MSSSSRVWLITGTSSGFGLETARLALAKGDRVVATLRRPEVLNDFAAQYPASQILVLRLDVSKPGEIKEAFAQAKAVFGRIDVVFNNAGYAVVGEAEGVPAETARAMFNVNYWGAVGVSQEAVRFFREENVPQGGRLIQNSAGMGLVTLPTFAFYSSSKHALEGFTETLEKELDPTWNIKITSVLCGGFVTDFSGSVQLSPPHPAYKGGANAATAMREGMLKLVDAGTRVEEQKKLGFSDASKAVKKIYELSELTSPPLRLLLGKDVNRGVRQYIAQLTKEADAYESWSDNLEYDH